ncbi:hypothetical protein GP486_007766 [Trichoglossum hirsutum]|uniref:Uncharacterized protein n=1 Tax=Trichoglossum hirsutum TaxID=265104 RepID=A0A9P8L7H6_9PEZI|nr:hypothetical protein GP486_007766 [Trichoglossum hirsutum]
MQLPSSTTHLEYDLNIVCGAYAHPFFVHVFLGDIPDDLDYDLPVDHPSWIAQQYMMPHSPDQLAAAAAANNNSTAPAAEESCSPDDVPPQHPHHHPRLPFLKHAITATLCLNPHLLSRLQLSSQTDLVPSTVTPYLAKNLRWRLSSAFPVRKEIAAKDIPIRLWVVESEVTPLPEGRWGPPKVERRETLWDATEGKDGSLRRGEMPEGEV